jgi:hypothetical protein
MEKLEHISIMLNRRTKGKVYENFIVNAIYAKISNPELIPITQQYVKNTNYSSDNPKKYYLLDLYFPQLNYGIEVDEGHHVSEAGRLKDDIRADDILSAIQCEQGRISIYNRDGIIKKYEEIDFQIKNQVEYVKNLISQKNAIEKLKWNDNDFRKDKVIKSGKLSIEDNLDFEGVTEIYNLLGNSVKNLGRCFVKLNEVYKLWVPYLAVELDDGTVKTKNGWENRLNEDRTIITEVVGNMDRCKTRNMPSGTWNEDGFKRVVFMHILDSFGVKRVKFIGIFEAYKLSNKNGKQTKFYRRVSTKINISDLGKS